MTSKAISISYTLQPPQGTAQPSHPHDPTTDSPATPIPATSTLLFPIPTLPASPTTPTKSQLSATTQYYTTTSAALLAAQTALNGVLTGWKDAVGDAEKGKEEAAAGFGRGKAMVMSERVNGEMKETQGAGSESEEDSEEDV
ncbi:hypothetical protein IAT38_007030 [Cryptococcus sp. DSM 104549]